MKQNISPTPLHVQWGRDLQLWLFIVATLQLFRVLLITLFHQQATWLTFENLSGVMFQGLRYDISTAATWLIPTFLLSLLPFKVIRNRLDKTRTLIGIVFVSTTIPLMGIDIVYFDEYGDQFNQHMFGLVHDDTVAILITVWKSYHPLWLISASALTIYLYLKLLRKWLTYKPNLRLKLTKLSTALLGVGGFILFVALLRGGTLTGEPIRLKHAFIVNDLFLNRTVLNPYSALRFTLQEKWALSSGTALETIWPESLEAALQTIRPLAQNSNSIDQWLTTTTTGGDYQKPQHIFMLLMESHSGWPVLPRYRSIGLSPELSRLADNGIYFPNFIPSGSGTIPSLNALITGLADSGLNINYEPESLKAYPFGIATLMKQLGYQTNFFYGGYLSWQRLDTFALNQGFDTIHGGGIMSSHGEMTNEWGVDDKILFDYVVEQTDPDKPSFNFILTTSNHPPYDLDLEKLGYPLKSLPEPLEITKDETIKVLGHLWYADQQIGRFVDKSLNKLPGSLFALTGDHTARLQIRFEPPNVFEQVAVPFIIYAPDMIKSSKVVDIAGSHIDIPSTLYEMVAPAGQAYTHLGKNLLAEAVDTFGFGHKYMNGRNFIATDHPLPQVFPLPLGHYQKPDKRLLQKMLRKSQALKAVSWNRVRNGNVVVQK